MKVFNFTPNHATRVNVKTGKTKTELGNGFANILNGLPEPTAAANPGKTISMENVKASKIPSPADLGTAGLLLGRLNSNIRASSPDILNNIHKLDYLIQVSTK